MVKLTAGRSEACRDICKDWQNKVIHRNGDYYIKQENCRCSICMKYLKWEGMFCPCCGYRVRRRPRGSESAIKCQIKRGMKRL